MGIMNFHFKREHRCNDPMAFGGGGGGGVLTASIQKSLNL